MSSFPQALKKISCESQTAREKGAKFERLIKSWLMADPVYSRQFENVWLWEQFPAKNDLGFQDLGIDLVARNEFGEYCAIQCKFHENTALVDKASVDSFISNSSRYFLDPFTGKKTGFAQRVWIAVNEEWGRNAHEAAKNLSPQICRLDEAVLARSEVDWQALLDKKPQKRMPKTPFPHQKTALEKAMQHFKEHDRGLLVMACGTGKTYTALLVAEKMAQNRPIENSKLDQGILTDNKQDSVNNRTFNNFDNLNNSFDFIKNMQNIQELQADNGGKNAAAGQGALPFCLLFLVPSISLLNQSLNAFFADASIPVRAVCICSDARASRKRQEEDDAEDIMDLALPATTDAGQIADRYFAECSRLPENGMIVFFSTYQSIAKVHEAQKKIAERLGAEHVFDLAICDEAHRTTGIISGEDAPDFTAVHNSDYIIAKKRLYMTATPRLYADNAKSRAKESDFELCSMDDQALYGKEFYRVSFGYAVANGLLTDYKVLVLTVGSMWQLPEQLREAVADSENTELEFDHISRLVGCINGLAKNTTAAGTALVWESDPKIMRRAIAFCPNIDKKGDPCSSKNTSAQLPFVAERLLQEKGGERKIRIRAEHIDGSMDSAQRSRKLFWLADDTAGNMADAPAGPDGSDNSLILNDPENAPECRVLCNVRCLAEGIDVPALDAAIFLSPRNSQIDVAQSVGRVMRNFRKGHADGKRFGYIIIPVVVNPNIPADAALNDNKAFAPVWSVLNALRSHDERFNAVINSIHLNNKKPADKIVVDHAPFYPDGGMAHIMGLPEQIRREKEQRLEEIRARIERQGALFGELDAKIYARMVEKVGTRLYWERWSQSMGSFAFEIIARIMELVSSEGPAKEGFNKFTEALRLCINDSITERQAAEMLGQHLITRPVFEALFCNFTQGKNNGITAAMQEMLEVLGRAGLNRHTERLEEFYNSVKLNLGNVNTLSGRQTVIKNLYDSFFKSAFPKTVEQLGIVYTPVECVDFIIHSADAVLRQEFGMGLTDEGVHIIDPFAGTGTFITRLLQSGLIKKEDMERKYRQEIHANELVLLAYYVACVNIESVFHSLAGREDYLGFGGICLADTFEHGAELLEKLRLFPNMEINARGIARQRRLPLRVILGNPPYSAGQRSGNDNAQNLKYPALDARIADTYAAKAANVTNRNSLYDSYIRAFRWASDRIAKNNEGGVIGFITNSKWLDGSAAQGLRKCLAEEFSAIYVFDLKGAIRGKSGETARKEGASVFNIMTGTCIVILVKNPAHQGPANIYYSDIGDYLSQREKLAIIRRRRSIFSPEMTWQKIMPDKYGDWLRKRSGLFESFIKIGDKKDKDSQKFFEDVYSRGMATSRDAWCWNYSRKELEENVKRAIDFYNSQCEAVKTGRQLNMDPKCFSWTREANESVYKDKKFSFTAGEIREGQYRPFCREWLYFSRQMNEMVYQLPALFPEAGSGNRLICISGVSGRKDFSCIMTDKMPDLAITEASQCFPLYYYEKSSADLRLFGESGGGYIKKYAVTDWILRHACSRYGNSGRINKETLFYYVYGLLHSREYRAKFADDLKKGLPRLPLPAKAEDFFKFAEIGKKLGEMHINYEKMPPNPGIKVQGAETGNFYLEKMRFKGKQGAWDKTEIIYNSAITISNIPLRAYEYAVNGRSAVEWVMECCRIKTDKDSGITNSPNLWMAEQGRPRYALDLLLSVIELSLWSLDLIDALPALDFGSLAGDKTDEPEETMR